ncbi:MAG TPA: hypothetical protein VF006_29705 [Longimicrobium sp.]
MMTTPMIRAFLLFSALCLSACRAEPEPDPAQAQAAALAARRAQSEAAMREKRAEFSRARTERAKEKEWARRMDPQNEYKDAQREYRECLRARRGDPYHGCMPPQDPNRTYSEPLIGRTRPAGRNNTRIP